MHIVGAGFSGTVDDSDGATVDVGDQGCVPGCFFVWPAAAPNFFAGVGFQGCDEGVFFLVPVDNQQVSSECWCDGFTPGEAGAHITEVFFPDQLAIECVAIDAA